MDGSAGKPRVIDLTEAAGMLGLSREGVLALVDAGYLASDGRDQLVLGDVKAFHARIADDDRYDDVVVDDPTRVDPQALLDALDGRSEEMARRAFEIFQTVFPDATAWTAEDQARFVDQARRRFEAILAVTAHGDAVDLTEELEHVGAAAAWSGSSLPQLLVVLRISRDLVVQTAVELADERGRHWGLALSLVLTRILPAIDRLTDAVALGYWKAIVGREAESRSRYESMVEHATDGVYEVDLDGRIQYANSALALVLGRRLRDLQDARITDVLQPVEGTIESLLVDGPTRRSDVVIERPDGVRRELAVFTFARLQDDRVVGFQGIVRDVSAESEIEDRKNQFLSLITNDLRQPLTTVLGLGATLESYASELSTDRLKRIGASIRLQAERMARLADDLDAVSRIEAQALMVNLRPISLRRAVEAALTAVDHDGSAVEVAIAPDLEVHADPRRLEQVVANLLENALRHGAPPVVVRAEVCRNDTIELTVDDAGAGVSADARPTLFDQVRRRPRDGSRGGGLGLVLVRGLVEAMGGRVWHSERPGGGATFHVTMSTPRVYAERRS